MVLRIIRASVPCQISVLFPILLGSTSDTDFCSYGVAIRIITRLVWENKRRSENALFATALDEVTCCCFKRGEVKSLYACSLGLQFEVDLFHFVLIRVILWIVKN